MTNDKRKIAVDKTGNVETTGHEWDGIKEWNNPAPRWWLWVFCVTVIWAICYWFVYPSWPLLSGEGERGGTRGASEWTQYKKLEVEQAEITARRSTYLKQFANRPFEGIMNDPQLYAFAMAGGKAAFKDNCATCHGTGGAGGKGYPNLNDDDWLWGGDIEAIYTTIKKGIRSTHQETRTSQMPAFAEMLSKEDVSLVAMTVAALSKHGSLPERGAVLFAENCASCHGDKGRGNQEFGAPNLADAIWLYSNGDAVAISAQVKNPRHGIMPSWEGRLDEQTIRQLAIYVHSLGGGE